MVEFIAYEELDELKAYAEENKLLIICPESTDVEDAEEFEM